MSQQLLTKSPEKTKQQIARREQSADPARSSHDGPPSPILQLHRTLGNHRVAQLIQTKRLTPQGKILNLQPKLTVGAADDQYEQEADRVARHVLSMPDFEAMAGLQPAPPTKEHAGHPHSLQSKPLPLAASITPFAQRAKHKAADKEEDQERDKPEEGVQAKRVSDLLFSPLQRQEASEKNEDEPVQAKGVAETSTEALQRQAEAQEENRDTIQAKSTTSLAESFDAGEEVEARLSQSKGGGSPLPDPVRAYMEPRFGVDFGHVRVHTGSQAVQMNRAVGAQAFTHGADIYYGAGSSPTNLDLTAHELTHVVQQTGGGTSIAQPKEAADYAGAVNRNPEVSETGSLLVQRDGPLGTPTPTPGPASSSGAVVTPPSRAELHAIVHEHRQLSEDWKQTQALLKRMIAEEGWEATDAWAYRFINAEPIRDLAYGDVALVARIRDRLRIEINMMENSVKQLVGDVKLDLGDVVIGGGDFPKAALDNTNRLLDNSEKQVKKEAARYGLKVEGLIFKDYSMTGGGPLQAGLQEAARFLAVKRRETNRALNAFLKAQKAVNQGNPFLPDLDGSMETTRKVWVDLEDAYHLLCQEKQKAYPILAAYTTLDDAVARLDELGNQDTIKLAENLYKTVDDRLKNIETVRSEIGVRYSIWKQPQIIALTKKTLNAEPWQSRVIDDKARKVKGDEAADAKFFGAIALGLGLLAAIPTGGTSLLAGVAVAGASVGAVYSMYSLYQHYKDYQLASAETGTAFDKAKAISKDEPDLLWLANDLLDLGMNMAGAAVAFKVLREAMLAAEASKLARLPEVIQAADRLGLSASGKARFVSYVVNRGGGTGNIKAMLKSILDTYSKLKPGADEALTKAFQQVAKQMMAEGKVGIYQPGKIEDLKRVLENVGIPQKKITQLAKQVANKMEKENALGHYFAPGGNYPGDFVILREGTQMPEYLAHELAHRAQSLKKELVTLGTLRSEYQAFFTQRELLLRLPEELIPLDSRWLLNATDAEIQNFILKEYKKSLAMDPSSLSPLDPQVDGNLIVKALKDMT